nr:thymocyte nuclear protein 1 isoform X2 [Odocoileus virginianus texanus]
MFLNTDDDSRHTICIVLVLSCFRFCDPTDCSPPGSSVHGILQARMLEWVAMPSSRGSSQPRGLNPLSLKFPVLAGGFFKTSTTWEAPTPEQLFFLHQNFLSKKVSSLLFASVADTKGQEGKRTKAQNLGGASAQVENSSLQKTPASEDGGEALSSYWLMKSEPDSRLEKGVDVKFSIEDLQAQPGQTTCWDGVRNYQARNFLRAMRLDEQAFFYHSNCREPGIAGLMKIVKEAYPDHTQFEKNNPHYDSSSKEDNPKWSMVDVQFVRMMRRFIPLAELRAHHEAHKASGGPLKNMALFTRQRLSVQRLTREEFDFILSLEEKEPS